MKKRLLKENESKSLNRDPKASVDAAAKTMKTNVSTAINKEIKDIVDDILKGDIKKAMKYPFTDNTKGGQNMGIKESEDKNLSEKELLMDETELLGGSSNASMLGNLKTQGQRPVVPVKENECEMPNTNKPKMTIEQELAEMGYGINEDEDVTDDPNMDDINIDGISEDEEIDLSQFGTDEDNEDMSIDSEGNETINDMMPSENNEDEESNEEDSEEMDIDFDMSLTDDDSEEGEKSEEGEELENDGEESEEDVESEEDEESENDEETVEEGQNLPVGHNLEIESTDYDDLNGEDKAVVDECLKEAKKIKASILREFNSINESVLSNTMKEKMTIAFEMYAEQKAKAIATQKAATITEAVNKYLKYVVKNFVSSKQKEIKEAIEASKKVQMYEEMKYMVENLFGTKTNALMESKKEKDFLTKVISKQKTITEALENEVKKVNEKLAEMESVLVFNEATKEMTYTDKEKVATFMETFDFNNVQDFKSKLNMVIEQYKNLKNDKKNVVVKNNNRSKSLTESKIIEAGKKTKIVENVDDVEVIDASIFSNIFWNK